ncbi:ABC transporter substrate-binding protein [Pseudooceanicola sp. GBMRC 2024]|uniref:ABC transporter substrate-binding protein n=1 Tax=Pseudooceanicola albus TaxID=2692189 RepID=A0A6L7G1T1_9RHOB|nr:ABC transporter substrate-binding protein [Pseudooceanicola albus]MXN17961.1 ABC transporter substrate-binding protein [Pseudooceanicola albus]
MSRLHRKVALGAALVTLLPAAGAWSQTLSIGLSAEPTSVDPQFHNLSPNAQFADNIFESLVMRVADQSLQPKLAESYKAVDDTTWVFKLREGVTFSDGTPFTARDVIYSICRVPLVENSPSPFTSYTQSIDDIIVGDDNTLTFKTNAPVPLFPVDMGQIAILSASASGAEDAVTFGKDGCTGMGTLPASTAFNDPKVAIGTGPYKIESYAPGGEIVLTENTSYWGEKPDFDRVVMRPITAAGPRVAALLAGDVDLIENPPIQDLKRIEDAGMTVKKALSNRVIYLALSQWGDDVPLIAGTDGKNPLMDKRVREALSLAINREAIVALIMGGYAEAAGELLPPPAPGTTGRKPDAYDPKKAKELLAEAGYPKGFEITIGTPNDRYINDDQVAQAIAQMFSQIGVKTHVDAVTASQFFARRNKQEFPIYLAGWGSSTGETSSPLRALIASYDKAAAMGTTNAARYSNADVDALIHEAVKTVDEDKRNALLQKAETLALDDWGLLPLHYEVTTWAMKPGVDMIARADQMTVASEIMLDTPE